MGDLSCHWFASRTLTALFKPGGERSSRAKQWEPLLAAARELLYSGEWRPTHSMPEPPRRGDLEKRTMPLLQLGSTLGQGANCLVLEAEPGPSVADVPSRLAVKMFSTGHDPHSIAEVMHEVHVLRQLNHENIVRLCDVVEMNDAVLVVMERVEGPPSEERGGLEPLRRTPAKEGWLLTVCRAILAPRRQACRQGTSCAKEGSFFDFGYLVLPSQRSLVSVPFRALPCQRALPSVSLPA